MRSNLLLLIGFISGACALGWPIFASSDSIATWQQYSGPTLSIILLPIALALIASDLLSQQLNTRTLALVGILTALAVAVRPLGAGVAGIEPMWAVFIIAGRALGAHIGFVLGVTAMLTSGFVTGAIGPWLPYQMLLAAMIGCGAGLLPAVRGRLEVWMLTAYAAVMGFLLGWFLNLWFWPNTVGLQPGIGFDFTDSPIERISAWVKFSLISSAGFDLPRSLLTAILVAITATQLLKVIRRFTRRVEVSHSAEQSRAQ
jgi:energy-coupling factor transport system substrate-specific component